MSNYSFVGKPTPRLDGAEKATGRAVYVSDLELPGMLYAKILRSPLPHARIVSIDVSEAQALPGVKAVITGRDTLGVRYGFVDTPSLPADEPPLAEDKVRYVGEPIAAVAAVSEEIAERALRLIKVKYEELPAVFDAEEAMKEGAPKIHEVIKPTAPSFWQEWGVARPSKEQVVVNNVASTCFVSYGDVDKGFKEAYLVREDVFKTSPHSHCCMETHDVVASYNPTTGFLDVWTGHMGFPIKQYWLARTLGLPVSKVRIRRIHIGGVFGGKIELQPHEFIAAFLSKKLGKPVKIVLTREEDLESSRSSQHLAKIYLKTGVTKDGLLVAQHAKVIGDCGAYRGSAPVFIFLAHAFSQPIYHIPNYKYEAYAVYTNKQVRVPKRGHGAPEFRFAMESQLDMLAEELGMDPAEIRLKNFRKKGDVLPNGDILHSCGLTEGLQKLVDRIKWTEKRRKGKEGEKAYGVGLGVAAMFNGAQYYPFGSTAVVRLNEDGKAVVFTGAAEFGQGSDTLMAQITAETLGLRLNDVIVISGDSVLCPIDMHNWLSGGTFVSGRAVKLAAEDAKRQLLEVAAEMLEASPEDLEVKEGWVRVKGQPERGITVSQAVRRHILTRGGKQIVGVGHTKAIPDDPSVNWYPSLHTARGRFTGAYSFTVAGAEVEVDIATGKVRVLKVTVAHDCGFPINPQMVEAQVEGQVAMGIGQALFEELATSRHGRVLNRTLADYKVARFTDMPEVETVHVITVDPNGPFGGKEVGEGVLGALPAAIANAVANAIGAWIKEIPMRPYTVLKAIKERSRS